jgi:hypothetical protein
MKKKSKHTKQKVKFYDPHHGFKGTAVRLPEPMRKIAKSLDNKVMTLDEAVGRISPVAEKVGGSIQIVYQGGFILFEFKEANGSIYGYRLIRYERV